MIFRGDSRTNERELESLRRKRGRDWSGFIYKFSSVLNRFSIILIMFSLKLNRFSMRLFSLRLNMISIILNLFSTRLNLFSIKLNGLVSEQFQFAMQFLKEKSNESSILLLEIEGRIEGNCSEVENFRDFSRRFENK